MVIRLPSHQPFPESALNEEAAKLMLEDYDEYFSEGEDVYRNPREGLVWIGKKPTKSGASDPTDAHENPSVKKAKGERKTDKKKSLRRL